MAELTELQMHQCDESPWDFSDLRALYINCTLKRSPEVSHTQGLADLSIAILERNGVTVDSVRAIDRDTGVDLAFGRNLERLARVKKAYDPHNFFRINNNIRPARA